MDNPEGGLEKERRKGGGEENLGEDMGEGSRLEEALYGFPPGTLLPPMSQRCVG